MEGYREDKTRLSSEVRAERTRGKGHKLQQGEFQEDMKEQLFEHETGAALGQVPGVFVKSLSLGILRTQLMKTSSHMI